MSAAATGVAANGGARPGTGRPPRRYGLRSQILAGLGLVTLFAVLSSGYLALYAAGGSLQEQREATGLSLARAAAAVAAGVVALGQPLDAPANRSRLADVVAMMTEQGEIVQAAIIGGDRRVLASRPEVAAGDTDAPVLTVVLNGSPPALGYRTGPGGVGVMLAYAPILVGRRVVGAVRLALAAEPPVFSMMSRSTSSGLLLALAIGDALLVLALGSFVLTQLVVRPLQAVERAAQRVSAGDLGQTVDTSGPREVASLAEAFNRMTSSIAGQRDQLIRTEKLASVGQLAAGIAHEIGNPLAAVLGYVDILRSDAAAAVGAMTPAERMDALDRVKGETQRIDRIIRDLLDFSRPSREEAIPTDPAAVLDGVEKLLAPQARWKAVRLVRETPNPWPMVLVSPGRLEQVLVNLLINAADAMNGQGRVGVSATVTDGRVRVAVADEGPGVAADLARRIFDPFFTTKEPGRGTGLGLPICRSILEQYGGTLELGTPAEGRPGARFVVTLPAVPSRDATETSIRAQGI